MDIIFFRDLVLNAVILLSASILYSFTYRKYHRKLTVNNILIGLTTGIVGIMLILFSVHYLPGIVFDTRSILVSTTGMFFGAVPTIIAVVIISTGRLIMGGQGAFTGVLVTVVTAGAGLLWHRLRSKAISNKNKWIVFEFYLSGLLTHVLMLACMLTLPKDSIIPILREITIPILFLYPLCMMLVCIVLWVRLGYVRAEADLRESEEKFRHVFENSVVGKSLTLPSGEVNVNKAMCTMLGYTEAELDGKKWQEISHPDDIELTSLEVDLLLTGKKTAVKFEKRYIRKDGSVFWAEVHSSALRNAEGKPVYLNTSIIDITERKQAEERLVQSEEKHRRLFETMAQGVVYQDTSGTIISVNPAAERILGQTLDQIRGKNSMDPTWRPIREDGSTLPGTEYPSMLALHTGWPIGPVVMGIRKPKSNDLVWLKASAIPLFRQGEERPFQAYATIEDITEQKRAEKAVLASETRYRRLFESAKDGILILDAETGMIVDVNPFLIDLLDYSKDQFLNKFVWEIGFFRDIIANRENFGVLQNREYVRYEDMPLQTASGKRIDVEFVSNVYDVDNKKVIQCNIRDITARKKAEAALVERELLYRTFIEASSDMIYLKDECFIHRVANNRLADYFGRKAEEVIGKSDFELMLQDAAEICRQTDKEAILSKSVQISDENIGDKVYETIKFPVNLANGKTGVGGFIRDITQRKQTEIEIKTAKEYLEKIIDSASAPIVLWDKDYIITRFNRAFENLTGRSAVNVIGKHLDILFPAAQASSIMKIIMELTSAGGFEAREINIIHVDGSIRTVLWNSAAVYDKDGTTPVASIMQGQDITDRVLAEKNLLYLSYHDQLTGLNNRRMIEEEMVRIDIKENLPLSVIMCDINGLKLINDSFGHTYGDEMLRKASKAILSGCKNGEVVARLGGDEFVILLPQTDASVAVQVIDNIKSLIASEKIANMEVSVSFGFDTKINENQKITETLANAENYMYRHKIYESSSMRSNAINIIMNTLFEKSSREMQHSKRVSELCELIASALHYAKEDVNRIRLAGLLHDIGKIGIDEKILNKNGGLTNEEWLEIKKHPEAGWRILSSTSEFAELARYILEHQEKWDGTGYPKGLKGTEITEEARIISIADAFDAMTSDRTYRKSMSREDALKEIEKCSGSYFDPDIVTVLLDALPENNNFRADGR